MEGLLAQSDIYCERTDLTYWSEPVNALSNLAFLIAAVILWRRSRDVPEARLLAVILAAIGLGSYFWHTHATGWGSLLDVGAIAVFILAYIFLANRDYWGLPLLWALVGMAAFVPWLLVTFPIFNALPFFKISNAYWPVATLILIYGIALRNRLPEVSHGLLIGVAILVVSLVARTVDEAVCVAVPLGTHWIWHLLNGIMLGWMIEVYRRHRVATVSG